jgi:hypothetical protein
MPLFCRLKIWWQWIEDFYWATRTDVPDVPGVFAQHARLP